MNNTASIDQTQKKAARKPFFLRRIQNKIFESKSAYLSFCFIVPVVLTYLLYLAMEIHPFGDGSVLVLDLNAQYVYFFEALRNAVHGDGDLLYSFSRALGGEFVGIYAYYLASPLSLIVALFPQERMLEALLTLFLLKSGLCGFTMGYYLHKNSKNPNRVIIVACSAMYALCAFAVVHQNNTMWTDALILLPLVTYGIEQLVKFGKYKLFVISLALTLWSNFYIGYMVCIYVALYFFYYFIAYGDGRNNPRAEKAHFLRSFIRIAVFSAIAVAISAFIILGAYYALSFGKNEFSSPDWTPRVKYLFLDMFTKFLPGAYDTVRPEGLPFVYTGLATIFLLPVYFVSKKVTPREKIGAGVILGILGLSMSMTTLDLLWHGFQNPNWLNARYSFIFCFLLIVFAYKGFGSLRQISAKFLLAILGFIVLFVAVCQKQEFETYVVTDEKLLTMETVLLTLLSAAIIFAVLCLIIKNRKVRSREGLSGILAAVICVELFCSSLTCMVKFDKDVVYSGYTGYTDFLEKNRSIVNLVLEDDKSFYRMERTESRTVNDNMALAIRGLSNSTSTLNSDTIDFLRYMGLASHSHWSLYRGETAVTNSILGVKYLINSKNSAISELYYEPAYTNDSKTAYRNDLALSLAFGADKAVTTFKMTGEDSHFERLNGLVAAMLGEDSARLFVPIEIDSHSSVNCEETGHSGHHLFSQITEGKDASVTYTITAPTDGEILFYAPSDYKREVSLTANKSAIGGFYGNDTDRIISLGVYSAGDTVDLTITLGEDKELYLMKDKNYFYYLDMEKYEEAFGKLKAGPQFRIEEGFKDSHLKGSIKTEKDGQMILTTIPFDEGWNIYVDGEKAEIYETLDALIAFDIPSAGEHTLEMRYMPSIYKLGATVSIAGILIFLAFCFIELVWKKLFRRILKLEGTDAEDIYWSLDDFDEDAEEESLLPPPKSTSIIDKTKSIIEKFKKKTIKDTKNEESTDNKDNGGEN